MLRAAYAMGPRREDAGNPDEPDLTCFAQYLRRAPSAQWQNNSARRPRARRQYAGTAPLDPRNLQRSLCRTYSWPLSKRHRPSRPWHAQAARLPPSALLGTVRGLHNMLEVVSIAGGTGRSAWPRCLLPLASLMRHAVRAAMRRQRVHRHAGFTAIRNTDGDV